MHWVGQKIIVVGIYWTDSYTLANLHTDKWKETYKCKDKLGKKKRYCSPRGDLTKNHHKAQPPHEISTPFHCSHQIILQSLFTSSTKRDNRCTRNRTTYFKTEVLLRNWLMICTFLPHYLVIRMLSRCTWGILCCLVIFWAVLCILSLLKIFQIVAFCISLNGLCLLFSSGNWICWACHLKKARRLSNSKW